MIISKIREKQGGLVMAKKKKKGQEVLQGENYVTCIYCGLHGHPDEINIHPETNHETPNWYCLARKLSGSTSDLQAVCRSCASKRKAELMEKFPSWFKHNPTLPLYTQTREKEEEYARQLGPALLKMKTFMESNRITTDTNKRCSNPDCGRHHGEIFPISGLPNVKLRVAVVQWVNGRRHNEKEVLAHLLCNDCAEKARTTSFVFKLDRTLQHLADVKERKIKGIDPVSQTMVAPIMVKKPLTPDDIRGIIANALRQTP